MKQRILAGVAAAAAASMLISAPASAEVPLTINLGATFWHIDGDRRIEDTETPFVSLEYAFDDNWAAEILYAEGDSRFNDGAKTDLATWQLGMLYYGGSYIGGGNRVRPYLTFGMGEIDIDAGSFDTVETTAHAGAGLRWMLTPRFGARLETRMLHSLDENENDFLFSAGLNYYFGKVSEPAVAAAPAAPMDSDGDGVTDDRDKCPGTPRGTRVDADGCPLPVAQVASIKLKVNFDFDSTVVKEHHFSDIGELATFLKRFDDLRVEVEGHTDSVGPENYNQQLSQRRAQAVIDLLVNQHGIARNRLEAIGYGEARPVASNDTAAGRAENRRVMATLEVEYKE